MPMTPVGDVPFNTADSWSTMDTNLSLEDMNEPDLPPAYPAHMEKKKDPMAGLTQQEKDLLKEAEVNDSWNEFTQNTTFHGVKYIFEDSPFKLRRILWVVMVVAAIIFFAVEVGLRTKEYFKHETNIDIERTFEDAIEFPAVTMCNQNAFRMTKAIDSGLYHFIDEIYGADNMSEVDFSQYDLKIGADDFLLVTSHQLEDMIDKCTWMGRPCNISRDFQTTHTSFGICYTFNGDPEDPKMVDDTAYALSLVLNVEQYEHMRGPQNDAGLKILLHAQDEHPLMRDRGFAVAPGVHTLASVAMTRKETMEPPWGKCSLLAPPVSVCKNNHKSEYLSETCKCKQSFMEKESIVGDVKNCTIQDRFVCLLQQDKEKMKIKSDTCTVPCNVSEFLPTLSYAQLSSINIDRLALTNEEKKNRVRRQFLDAKEALQRIDHEIVEYDKESLSMMLGLARNLNASLHEGMASLAPGSPLDMHFWETKDGIMEDKENINRLKQQMEEILHMKKEFMEILVQKCFLDMFLHLFSENDDIIHFFQWTDYCLVTVKPSMLSLPLELPDMPTDDDELLETCKYKFKEESGEDHSEEHDEDEADPPPPNDDVTGAPQTEDPMHLEYACDATLRDLLESVQEMHMYGGPAVSYLTNVSRIYEETVSVVFNDTGHNITDYEEHQACLSALNTFDMNYIGVLRDLATAFTSVIGASTFGGLNTQLWEVYRQMEENDISNFTIHLHELEEKCWWMEEAMHGYHGANEYDNAETMMNYAESTLTALMLNRDQIKDNIEDIKEHIKETISPTLNMAEQYLQGDITKLSMSETFSDMELTKALEDLLTYNAELKSYIKAFQTTATTTAFKVQTAFKKLFETIPPVANTTNLQTFYFVQYANNANNTELHSLWETLSVDKEAKVHDIINWMVQDEFTIPADDLSSSITPLVTSLTKHITKRQTKSVAYVESCEMNEEFFMANFLQVDIFYNELSFEIVRQRQAFALLSLFGEVGGFMGLLLGASILTLCELIDYIAMFCMKRCHARKKPAPMPAWQRP